MQLISALALALSIKAASASPLDLPFTSEIVSAATGAAGQITSVGAQATSLVGSAFTKVTDCASAAGVLGSELASVPTPPPGPLRDFLNNNIASDACKWQSQVPTSLTSSYSSYTSALHTWYDHYNADVTAMVSQCANVKPTVPALPACTTGADWAASNATGNGKAPGSGAPSMRGGLSTSLALAVGVIGAVAFAL